MPSEVMSFCYGIDWPAINQLQPPYDWGNGRNISVSLRSLYLVCTEAVISDYEGRYSSPMVLIGIYISIASSLCILAMALDLLYGFRNRKFWFPCKYFSLNAASITVITVAMKLPVDLNSSMLAEVDQVGKIGGLAFMCIMMSNLMPSLASKDNKSLIANVTGLSILVITVVVNVSVQIRTQVIDTYAYNYWYKNFSVAIVACIYMSMLLFLLIILISSAITLPTSKKILEFKYQGITKTASNDQNPQENLIEKLRQTVKRYWIMAETGSPQFVMASTPLSCASGIICVISSSSDDTNQDLSNYVLLLEDNMELAERTMKRIYDSMNRLIHNAEKKQHKNLLKLLDKSIAFEGVETFDTDQVQSLLSVEPVNSWSLPIVSLTCIAIALPNIRKDIVDNLLESVGEGILFTHLVEESLNRESVYVNIRRATMALWLEVEDKCKWLETTLKASDYEGKTPTEIINLFAHKAENIVNEFQTSTNYRESIEPENLPLKIIVANSMYRVAQTIIHTYASNNLDIVEEELFTRLYRMIADILAASLTNIPQVITMKCRESAIEKRETSVLAAIDLLGRTTEIIKKLETRELPNMDPDKMGFIDEWRLHLKQP
ncbi:hypothetical protein SSX86_004604 [Deinandra increscens subsp. villosa]|uniref:Uncharacterized protein n=1 Tax=Deinandra increscens subsp. villosa TaxID=3103831 RepID=A0AAP0DJI3_9ASTR